MRLASASVLIVHGLIHLIGPAQALGLMTWRRLPRIGPALGAAWFLSAILFVVAGFGVYIWPRHWWAIATAGALISQGGIVATWPSTKFGTVINVVVFAGAFVGLCIDGPVSLRAQFEEQADWHLARFPPDGFVADRDVSMLPAPVQRYLRTTGVVGQPRVHNVYVRMHGRLRTGPDRRWTPFTAEQYNFFDERSRLFYMEFFDGPMIVQRFHRYVGPLADNRARIAGIAAVLDIGGDDVTRSETVALFSDMAALAPASLIDPAILWTSVGDNVASATFENAMLRVRATFEFNDRGELVSIWSDDRVDISADGKSFERHRWSLALDSYRSFGSVALASRTTARWQAPDEGDSYLELQVDEIQHNLRTRVRVH